MIKHLLLFAFCLVAIQAQSPTLCQNSPKTYLQLQGILKDALSYLGSPIKTINPLRANLDNTCAPPTKVDKCGYPSRVVQDAGQAAMVNNPDIAYQGLITNSSKLANPTDPGSISDFLFQLRTDEALVYLTCTPPSQYFSYSVMLYSDGLVSASNPKALRQGIIGDSLNHLRIKTWSAQAGNPRNAATLLVIAADQRSVDKITKAFTASGFPASAINVMALPVDFLNLGIGTSKSYLTIVGRQSILTDQEKALVYGLGAASSQVFPYVRLTPLIDTPLPDHEIIQIPSWIPDYNSADLGNLFKQSEQTYEPAMANAISTIVAALRQRLPATVANRTVAWNISPQRSFRNEDYGEKWVMEKEFGLASGRDSSYYAYNPVLTPVYDSQVGLGATVLVGFRHESTQWTVANPAVRTFTPSAKPHALFWNAVWNNPTTLAAVTGFNNLHAGNKNWTSLPISNGVGDPLNVIWVNAFGSATVTTPLGQAPGVACGVLAQIGISCIDAPAAARNIPGLTVLYRTYVDPTTGVHPAPITIASAQLLSIQGVFTS